MVTTAPPPAVVGFIDQDYSYKSVVKEILHNFGFSSVHPAGDRTWDRCVRGSDSASEQQQQTNNHNTENSLDLKHLIFLNSQITNNAFTVVPTPQYIRAWAIMILVWSLNPGAHCVLIHL